MIISSRQVHRFVQFASLKGGDVRGEAIGNHFLSTEDHLSPAAINALRGMRWNRPHTSGVGSGNFWRCWPAEASSEELAAVAVRSLREGLGIASPAVLQITTGEFATMRNPSVTLGIPAHLDLRRGQQIRNEASGRTYLVGDRVGRGGFGVVYRAKQVAGAPLTDGGLCVKVTRSIWSWHCEAYFGHLLQEESRVVKVFESFAWSRGTKGACQLYCLITEFVENRDLARYLQHHPDSFGEVKARREMIALLKTLRQLHAARVVHRDLTPSNVLVGSGGSLKISDFGIAAQNFKRHAVEADAFNEAFAPPIVFGTWSAADDVFHCGQLYAFLLAGRADTLLSAQDVRKLPCSPEAKAVIQRCIGTRRKRYASASEMLRALESLDEEPPRRVYLRSLAGKRVVFTGKMRVARARATRRLRKAGGIPQSKVGHLTDVVVRGDLSSPLYKAVEMGQKLLDIRREREFGHEVVELKEARFWQLCRR